MDAKVLWRLITCLVFAAIGSSGADFEHYTWWSIAWFGIYGTMEELGIGKNYFWFVMSMQLGVIVGTNVMGGVDCDVFEKAFESLGATKFILGNFAMHYLPSLVIVATASPRHVYCGENSAMTQIWCAYGLFLIWHHLRDPWAIYGCSLPHALGISGMLLLSSILSVLALYLPLTKEKSV